MATLQQLRTRKQRDVENNQGKPTAKRRPQRLSVVLLLVAAVATLACGSIAWLWFERFAAKQRVELLKSQANEWRFNVRHSMELLQEAARTAKSAWISTDSIRDETSGLAQFRDLPGDLSVTVFHSRVSPPVLAIDVDVQAGGKHIPGLRSQDFTLQQGDHKPLHFAVAETTVARGNLNIAIALDTSGSMQGQRWAEVTRALKVFLGDLPRQTRVRLLPFGDTVSVATPWTIDREIVTSAVDQLSPGGGTALSDALFTALRDVATREGSRAVVVLTDGNAPVDWEALQAEAVAAKTAIHFVSASAKDSERAAFERVAMATGGSSEVATKPAELVATLEAVHRRLLAQVYRIVVLDFSAAPMTIQLGEKQVEVTIPNEPSAQ